MGNLFSKIVIGTLFIAGPMVAFDGDGAEIRRMESMQQNAEETKLMEEERRRLINWAGALGNIFHGKFKGALVAATGPVGNAVQAAGAIVNGEGLTGAAKKFIPVPGFIAGGDEANGRSEQQQAGPKGIAESLKGKIYSKDSNSGNNADVVGDQDINQITSAFRVIRPGDAVTDDYCATRLNIYLDTDTNRINRVNWG